MSVASKDGHSDQTLLKITVQPTLPRSPGAQLGTIDFVNPSAGLIQMSTNGNAPLAVLVTPATTVRVMGTATADFIRVGVQVEFTAEVDEQHNVEEKISQLTVFAPGERPLGLFPEGSTEATPAKRSKPGVLAVSPDLPATCLVRGRVRSCRAGKLRVDIGSGHADVKAELADDAQVSIDSADLRFARKGDGISVTGTRPPMRGAAANARGLVATSVTILAAEPFGAGAKPKKKGNAPATADP